MRFKRFNKTFCTLALAALYTITTYGVTVTDVTSSHWAYSAIVNLEEKGVISLNASGQFFPNQLMDYFEVADVLARATGYVDPDVSRNTDATLLASIASNYESKKPLLQSYAKKYSTWNSAYNQQIAYLLGKGCLTTADLDKFITKTATSETKNPVTKEELSIFIVRMLGKEKTAKTYTATGFKDEVTMSAEAKPYMAYLKSIGIINADAAGNGNGKSKVTKALCAKMVYSALEINESTKNQGNTSVSTPNTTNPGAKIGVVKKVLTKNQSEYHVMLQIGENTSYYSIKNTTKILDAAGNEVSVTKLVGQTLEVTLAMEGSTEYITTAKIATQTPGTTTPTPGITTPTLPGTTTPTLPDTIGGTTPSNGSSVTNDVTISGVLSQEITNGICRLTLTDGTPKTFILDTNYSVTLNGRIADVSEIAVGDTIVATAKDSIIMSIQAISGSNSQLNNGEITEIKIANGDYNFTIKQESRRATVSVPESATITRNGKNAKLDALRVGDTINVTKVNGIVTQVQATSIKTTVQGTISQIIVGSTSQVVVNVNKVPITYNIASDAEIYDTATDKVISIRDLHLGQTATLLLDSKEVISLDIDSKANSVNLVGTITKVGRRAAYIDVLVDYDYVTGESKVNKRIELTDSVKVNSNGKSKDIYDLEADMNVVITFKYLDDVTPQKITIII